ncbi:hypothetical protein ABTY61_22525 [Kitasatospora sp. NPDC096128]|uniref:hypothetical protein n=1 Tax=Kitasatospora sp. NPDC096128 TaxID=3155547 RepID=UPI003328C5CF
MGALPVTVVAATCERGPDVLNFGGGAYAFAWRPCLPALAMLTIPPPPVAGPVVAP